jgi:hypothetical protein
MSKSHNTTRKTGGSLRKQRLRECWRKASHKYYLKQKELKEKKEKSKKSKNKK